MEQDNQIKERPKCAYCDNQGILFMYGKLICYEHYQKVQKKQTEQILGWLEE